MRQVELAIGLVLLFAGSGSAIYMLTIGPHTYYSSEAYTTYALGGGALAILGILMTVYGLGGQRVPSLQQPVVTYQPSGGKTCIFCGNLCAPEAVMCPKCGRQFQ